MSWWVASKHNLFSEKEIRDLLKMSTWFLGSRKSVVLSNDKFRITYILALTEHNNIFSEFSSYVF